MFRDVSETAQQALETFAASVSDFLSSSCDAAKPAAALLILSLTAYEAESGERDIRPLRLIRGAFALSEPDVQRPSPMDALLMAWHDRRRFSPAWELYAGYRDNPPRVRHHTLALLAGGYWLEFFLREAEETVRVILEAVDIA